MKCNDLPAQERLHELFTYSDGKLFWKVCVNNRAPIGSKAGSFNAHNQRWYVRVDKRRYLEHRLIFMFFHGWVPKEVDHIDTNRLNNSIENLRAASTGENQRNKPLQCNNTSGSKNVRYRAGKWQVDIKVNRKKICVGRFDDFEFADLVAAEARNKYHKEFACHV